MSPRFVPLFLVLAFGLAVTLATATTARQSPTERADTHQRVSELREWRASCEGPRLACGGRVGCVLLPPAALRYLLFWDQVRSPHWHSNMRTVLPVRESSI